jgi:cytochrome c-type biogenesis protein
MSFDLASVFIAGLLTFTSPCVLPLVPVYLGILGGAAVEGARTGTRPRLAARTAAFVLGLATVFVALGIVASAAGRLLAAHRPLLLTLSGVVVVGFGLRFLGFLRLPLLDREQRPWLQRLAPGSSLAGAFAFGGAFALGWTPCIGPVLGSVLTYTASTGANAGRGALYLGLYSAGLAAPLLAAAMFAPVVVPLLNRLKPHLRRIEIATGILLVGLGVLMATDKLMVLMPATEPVVAHVASTTSPPGAVPWPRNGDDAASCTAVVDTGRACDAPQASWAPPTSAPAVHVHGPAVVEIMSGSCPICQRMAPVVAEAERGCPMSVIRTFIEEPAGAELARRHGVRGVPTFLVLDASDAEMKRLVGQQPADAIRHALELVSPHVCEAKRPYGGDASKGS